MISLSVIVAFVISGEVSAQITERVSVDSSGAEGDGNSHWPSISSDGRYVAFYSHATNLVAGDTNGFRDVFVHDRQTGQTTRVSVDSTGVEGDADSSWHSISSDGRYVAFDSRATNLVAGDTNGSEDVFVHDRQTGQTTRASVDSTGIEGDGDSVLPRISSDGRYVAFESLATNLVAGDTNGSYDVFVHDRQTGQTTRVSVDSTGVEGDADSSWPSISSDGRYVAFHSYATNLVAGDTNGSRDVFVHDRQTGQTTRVSVDSTGIEGDGGSSYQSISSDGRYVAFYSYATNLVTGDTNSFRDVFVHDRQTGQTTRVSVDSTGAEGDRESAWPSISSDGRYVAFDSVATNLVAGDNNGFRDVFVHDSLGQKVKGIPAIPLLLLED
jgi:Tol biopolymer transport system component